MRLGMRFIGAKNKSDGGDLIIKLADEDDDRPLWITCWGGGNTLAQAIWQIKPKQGIKIKLDASRSYDPDGDKLVFNWWVLSEAGSYSHNMNISKSDTNCVTIDIPSDSAGKSFHVICEVTDNGTHNLTSYRRIIFNPQI